MTTSKKYFTVHWLLHALSFINPKVTLIFHVIYSLSHNKQPRTYTTVAYSGVYSKLGVFSVR